MKTYILLFNLLLVSASLKSQTHAADTLDVGVQVTGVSIPSGSTMISSLTSSSDNNIWFGTGSYKFPVYAGKGLYRFDMINWKRYSSADASLPSDNVYSLHHDFAGNVWIGTNKGLAVYDKKNKYKVYNKGNSSLKCDSILDIDSRFNYVYVATSKGIYQFNGGTFINITPAAWSLPNTEILSVCVSKDGSITLGTEYGIVSNKSGSWKTYDSTNSVFRKCLVHDMKEDGQGRIWVSTSANGPYLLESAHLYAAYERFSCYASIFYNLKTGQLAVDENGSVFMKGIGNLGSGNLVMMEVNADKITQYHSYQGFGYNWQHLHYHKGYLWKTDNNTFSVNRFNYRAYKVLLPVMYPGYELSDTSYAYLDINKVRAVMQNKGDMFYHLFDRSTYEDKEYRCRNMFSRSALWIGALDEANNLRLAAMSYRQRGSDYTSGPLNPITLEQATWRDFNRIWKINRHEIETFKARYADGSVSSGAYKIPRDILTWPAHGIGDFGHNIAPFVDVDSDGNYNPYRGDYPLIKGDQMLYWIFNDQIFHSESQAVPLGVEVHASAYAFNCDTIDPWSPRAALNRTTFYDYKIINRSTNTYKNARIGVWADFDIGNYADDYVGSNPRLNYVFGYNADATDEGLEGFNTNPPIVNILFLSDSLGSFMSFTNGAPYPVQDPNNGYEMYNYMQSKFQNGINLKYGGIGVGTQDCNFAYPSDDDPSFPGQTWTEQTAGNKPGDRRGIAANHAFQFNAGAVITFTYAIMHTFSESTMNDFALNEERVKAIRNYYFNNKYPACSNANHLSAGKQASQKPDVNVYPNPGSGQMKFDISLKSHAFLEIKVMNMMGQEVYSSEGQNYSAGDHSIAADLSQLPAGVYVYSIKAGEAMISGKLVIQK